MRQPEIRWTDGRFEDAQLEAAFIDDAWPGIRLQTGLTLIGFSLAWLLSLNVDFTYLPGTGYLPYAAGARGTSGVFGVLAGLWLILARPGPNARTPRLVVYLWAALSAMTAVIVASTYPLIETTADGITDILTFTCFWMSIQVLGLGIALSAWAPAVVATALVYAIGYTSLVTVWTPQLEFPLHSRILVIVPACGFAGLLTVLFSRRARLRYFTMRLYEEAKIVAEKAQEFTTFLLAATGHDIRQPIYALNLNASMLEDFIEDKDWDQARNLVQRQRQALSNVSGLISSVLELSHLDTDRRHIETGPVELDPVIAGVLAPLRLNAADRGVALTAAPTGLWVKADRGVVEHILANLVANAISHAQADKVLVGARRRGAVVDLMVIDDGRGMSETSRTLTAAEMQPGAAREGRRGLGLEIIFRLAEKAGLELTLTSRPGRGVAACLRCPRENRP